MKFSRCKEADGENRLVKASGGIIDLWFMIFLQTERLILRELVLADAAFILELLNDPAWLRFIGDRGVRTHADAEAYLVKSPLEMYARHGFGLWRVERKVDGRVMGTCGLIKRETLADVDLGYAFLPAYVGHGYAFEAAQACVEEAERRGLPRLVAIVSPDNVRSIALLAKLGFSFEQALSAETHLYGRAL